MQSDHVRRIKEILDIVDIVRESVELRKNGHAWRGLCPFHNEKTPSFYVSSERQTYHCFGCGAGGDVFSFVMAREGLSFPEALEQLASRAGVVLPSKGERREGHTLLDAVEEARMFFSENLASASAEHARKYLERRSLAPQIQSRYGLGWAPSAWDALGRHLTKIGVSEDVQVRSGLVVRGDRGVYDRFRGRIMFPIRDVAGRTVAFGGRIIDGDGAKYVNSPEGELFRKREMLYLLYEAKAALREKGRAILVEGYMDALALHQHGFAETVASLGTALSEEQATLLSRFTPRCYIAYDSDLAGQEATLRGMYILLGKGIDVRVVVLPSGKDPDELLRGERGPGLFEKALHDARPLVLHHIALRESALRDPAKRKAASDDLLQGLSKLSAIEVAPYMGHVAGALDIGFQEARSLLERMRTDRQAPNAARKEKKEEAESTPRMVRPPVDDGEAALLFALWNNRERRCSEAPERLLLLVEGDVVKTLVLALLQGEKPEELETRLLAAGDQEAQRLLALGGEAWSRFGEEKDCWNQLLRALEKRAWKREYDALRTRCHRGEASGDDLKRYNELARRLKGGREQP